MTSMGDEFGSFTHRRARHHKHHFGESGCLSQKNQRLKIERVWGGGENQGVDPNEQEYTPLPNTEAGVLRSH